ncbi:MAG: DNA polymerase [Candidatus Altiarchaeota archaeon]|nr:DNA polymerase [Candidatus Altiarchaeota archaeon]
MILLGADYGGDSKTKVVLYGRGGMAIDSDFLPYVYLLPEKEITQKTVLKIGRVIKIEEVERILLNKPVKVWKVYFKHPKDVPITRGELREFGQVLEADIPFIRRYMIDKNLKPMFEITDKGAGKEEEFKLRTLAFDIECLTEEGGLEIGKGPVIMVSLWGEGLQKVIGWGSADVKGLTLVEDEAALIREFLNTVRIYKPEVIVGYNSDGFDWPYLKERAKMFKIPFEIDKKKIKFVKKGREMAPKIEGIVNVDLYIFIRNLLSQYMKSENLKLNTVVSELVGEEKIKIGGGKGIDDAWRNNPQLLYDYSLQDAKVTYLLANEVLPMVYTLSKLVGQTIFDVSRMSPGQVVEWLLIRRAHERGILTPNRPGYGEASERRSLSYEGAFVKEPVKGLHAPIALCDFRSLYPTIIMAHNISPDTITTKGKNQAPSGARFSQDVKGFIPETLQSLFDERMELKAKLKKMKRDTQEFKAIYTQQNALKLVLNSFYGYLGYANARWYNLDAAKAITSWGRKYIKDIMDIADANKFLVVYGDTDSVMLTSESDDFEGDVKKFLKNVNTELPDPIRLELDGFFVRGVFVTKKRYALLRDDGSLVVKGLEKVRRDWSDLARGAQEIVIKLVLENRVEEAKTHVKSLVKQLRAKETPLEQLVIRTQLTKSIESYQQMAPHVKVAKVLKEAGKRIYPGMLIEYIVTPRSGSISERSVPKDLAKDYDAEYYVEHQLLPAVMRVLEAVGGKEQELRMKQTELDKWF